MTMNEVKFRADPTYHSQKGTTTGWHDWALADFDDGKTQKPIQLITFLKIKNVSSPAKSRIRYQVDKKHHVNVDSVDIDPSEQYYVLCHALQRPLGDDEKKDRPHVESWILKQGRKAALTVHDKKIRKKKLYPHFFILPASRIKAPLIGVPNLEYLESPAKKNKKKTGAIAPARDLTYIFVASRNDWPSIYMERIKQNIDADRDKGSKKRKKKNMRA